MAICTRRYHGKGVQAGEEDRRENELMMRGRDKDSQDQGGKYCQGQQAQGIVKRRGARDCQG